METNWEVLEIRNQAAKIRAKLAGRYIFEKQIDLRDEDMVLVAAWYFAKTEAEEEARNDSNSR